MPQDLILPDGERVGLGDDTGQRPQVPLPISQGFIKKNYDFIALTYVAAGNGAGKVETATYKTGGSGGTVVGTLTLTYDSNDKIASITKS